MRLAVDSGLSEMAVSRLIRGEGNPTYRVVSLVVEALEKQLRRHIDARELISYSNRHWERPICEVCGCTGCLPSGALMDNGELHPNYQNVQPGKWMSFLSTDESITLYHKED